MQNYSHLLMEPFPLEEILARRSHIILTWPEYYEKAIENFTAKAKLKSLNILTTNTDGKTDFVSSTAGYKHPVYSVQWHPEKALFEQKWLTGTSHTTNVVEIEFYLAEFFFFFS